MNIYISTKVYITSSVLINATSNLNFRNSSAGNGNPLTKQCCCYYGVILLAIVAQFANTARPSRIQVTCLSEFLKQDAW